MKLRQAHQILIASAIVLAVLFALRSAVLYLRAHATEELAIAIASLLVAVALAFYLRRVREKWASKN